MKLVLLCPIMAFLVLGMTALTEYVQVDFDYFTLLPDRAHFGKSYDTDAGQEEFRQMLQNGIEAGEKLRSLMIKLTNKVRERSRDYFERDNLGNKMSGVAEILFKRFAQRVDGLLDYMD